MSASTVEYPLSAGQEAFWFLHRLEPASCAYNVTVAVRIHAPVDDRLLTESVRRVTLRHEMLRSYYTEDDFTTTRLLHPEPSTVTVHDGHGLDDPALYALALRLVHEPFRLDRSPPFRTMLIQVAPAESVLLVVAHHIATDLSSQVTVLREIIRHYSMLSGHSPFAPPEAGVSFDEAVAEERAFLGSARRTDAEAYWRAVCDGARQLPLPGRHPRPVGAEVPEGEQVRFRLGSHLSKAVEAAAAKSGTTVSTWMMTAFQWALSDLTGQRDFLLGYPATLRHQARQRQAVGYYINLLPLRATTRDGATFQETLERNQAQLHKSRRHRRYPFAMMPCVLGQAHSDGRPGIQATFNLISIYARDALMATLATGTRTRYAGLELAGFPVPQQLGQNPLAMDIHHLPLDAWGVFKFKYGAVGTDYAPTVLRAYLECLESLT